MSDTKEVERQKQIEQAILSLGRSPRLLHRVMFKHRHPNDTPLFHDEMIDLFWSDKNRVLFKAFRGAAKSTRSEEAITGMACLQRFKNGLILGENEDRAKERLRAVRHEIETNLYIQELFGNLKGEIWGETKILLSNGVMIQAYGRGQSLRGVKHLDARPDIVFIDDLEDKESVATPEMREKTRAWLFRVVIPAMDNIYCPIRYAGTPLHPDALVPHLEKLPEWEVMSVPVEYIDPEGARTSSWPSRFPLSTIDDIKTELSSAGQADAFQQEYMCEAMDVKSRIFQSDMFRYEPTARTYQAVYAVYDPARTAKESSAMTGKVVASWVQNRLIIWEASGHLWQPDEIVNDMFSVDSAYNPVALGIEEDGLNEFILQPLRQAQINRGHPLPIRPLKAPKGKLDFIRAIQPFFKAREIILAGDVAAFATLTSQLLNFPTGRIDVPNALAYFLRMRPGQPIYGDFEHEQIVEDLTATRAPTWLALNATGSIVTGVLAQLADGGLRVIADFVREGSSGDILEDIVREARLGAGMGLQRLRYVAPASVFKAHDTVGLRGAAARIPIQLDRGGVPQDGREEIRAFMRRRLHGMPAFRVSSSATWTLRALSGGYSKQLKADGTLTDDASEGGYKVLMEGLEAFVALMGNPAYGGDDNSLNYDYTADGRRFISARARS